MIRISFKIAAILTIFHLFRAFLHAQPIAILGAFEEELTWLQDRVVGRSQQTVEGYRFVSGQLADQDVVLALTGVGKVNAAILTTLLIEHYRPKMILFSGVAGGIDPELLPGDIVIGERTVQHDLGDITPEGIVQFGVRHPLTGERNPVFFPADSSLLALAKEAIGHTELEEIETTVGLRAPKAVLGTIATGDLFITSTPKKTELHEDLKVDAVEMEGAALAQVCYQFGVPCLVVRALSDKSDENAEIDFERFYQVAARNANRLVLNLIAGIGKTDAGTYRDNQYGFEVTYPGETALKTNLNPQGGLTFAYLKDDAGNDIVHLVLVDLSDYPTTLLATRAATFKDAVVYALELVNGADGPDMSRYCSGVETLEQFTNPAGISVIKAAVTISVENYADETSITEILQPVYLLDLPLEHRPVILIVEPVQGVVSMDDLLRRIAGSVRM